MKKSYYKTTNGLSTYLPIQFLQDCSNTYQSLAMLHCALWRNSPEKLTNVDMHDTSGLGCMNLTYVFTSYLTG